VVLLLMVLLVVVLSSVQAFGPPPLPVTSLQRQQPLYRYGCAASPSSSSSWAMTRRRRTTPTTMLMQGKDTSNPTPTTPLSWPRVVRDKLLLGVEPSPDVYAILVVYFVQGAIGLARLATTFYLKDDLHLSPAESAALTGIFSAPWLLKPLYGFLSDGFPLGGYRRRSYLALSGLLGALSYSALASPGVVDSVGSATLAITLGSLSVAVSDVVADSLVVEKIRAAGPDGDPKLAGGLQSLCWGSSAIGGIISAYFSGALLETIGTRGVYGITATLPLLVTLISLAIQETRLSFDYTSSVSLAKEQATLLWSALTQKSVYLPLLFLVLWQGSPSSDSAFFYFLTNELHMQPEFLGRVRLGTSIASLAGVWLYQRYLREVPIAKILLWTTLASVPVRERGRRLFNLYFCVVFFQGIYMIDASFLTYIQLVLINYMLYCWPPRAFDSKTHSLTRIFSFSFPFSFIPQLGLTQLILVYHLNTGLGIPNELFTFGDSVVLTVLGQIAFMPTLVLAARLCPPGIEGTLFATLMSVFNGAGAVGAELGALLTSALGVTESNFQNLGLLVAICNLSSLLSLPFLSLLPEEGSPGGGKGEEKEGEVDAAKK